MAMLARAFAAKVPFAWVTADEAYGQVKYLRLWLEARDAAHVLVTKVNDTLVTTGGREARGDPRAARRDRPEPCRRRRRRDHPHAMAPGPTEQSPDQTLPPTRRPLPHDLGM